MLMSDRGGAAGSDPSNPAIDNGAQQERQGAWQQRPANARARRLVTKVHKQSREWNLGHASRARGVAALARRRTAHSGTQLGQTHHLDAALHALSLRSLPLPAGMLSHCHQRPRPLLSLSSLSSSSPSGMPRPSMFANET